MKFSFGNSHDDQEIERIKEDINPVYIYGAGVFAQNVERKLAQHGVNLAGRIVDDIYWSPDRSLTRLSDIIGLTGTYSIVIGIESLCNHPDRVKDIFRNCFGLYTIMGVYDFVVESITMDDYNKHFREYDRVYERLEDDLSKKTFYDYLRSKIEEDNQYIVKDYVAEQYFLDMPYWSYREDEVFLDVGAFDGDTVLRFISSVNEKYERIYAVEPDPDNLNALKRNTGQFDNIIYIESVMGDSSGTITFNSDRNLSSRIDDNGDMIVKMETIDELIGDERVSLIKMDIEGAEMLALDGARRTISREHPMLFICIYHKKDDAYRIMDFIDSCYPNYHYYMRAHHPIGPLEVVLYAIPEERFISGEQV
ncbi:MAG: FkbM family methyltransferase [Lachnospiraceae bacterium]|nr:FkbM family methyltransferase [Lachnospiraceae bacterium]